MKPNITRSLVESRFYYVDGILFHKKKRITNKNVSVMECCIRGDITTLLYHKTTVVAFQAFEV